MLFVWSVQIYFVLLQRQKLIVIIQNKLTMLTNRPTVRVILATDKKRPDGTMPYFILVTWRGRAKEKTGCYGTTKTGWRNYPDIRSRVNAIEARIDALIEGGGEFTAADCLRPAEGEKSGFLGVLTQLDRDRRFGTSTLKNYREAIRHLERSLPGVAMNQVTTDMLKGVAAEWARNYKPAGVWCRLSCLRSLYNYAFEKDIIKVNPFKGWRFKGDGYKPTDNPKARSYQEVERLWDIWENTHSVWVGLWLACYTFNGLALCDLLRVDWEHLEVKQYPQSFYVGTINRQKTRQKVTIIAKVNNRSESLRDLMIEVCKVKRDLHMWTKLTNFHLGQLEFNPKLTYYQARHTYATMLVNKSIPLNDIATLLGRNINNLGVYIKQVQATEHLAQVVSILTPLE